LTEWINQVLQAQALNFTFFLALLLLGFLTALISCCNIGVIGALTGYVGGSENNKRRDSIITAIGFMVGTILALVVIGGVIGYAGQIFGKSLGLYSKAFAGFVSIFFGLVVLKLLPLNKLKLPNFNIASKLLPRGVFGAVIFGFALGGASIGCSLSCCGPGLAVVLGASSLQGSWAKGALLMGVFGIGYSIPLSAALLGVSFGKWGLRASKVMPFIRIVGGAALIVVGLYFLATI